MLSLGLGGCRVERVPQMPSGPAHRLVNRLGSELLGQSSGRSAQFEGPEVIRPCRAWLRCPHVLL